MLEATARHRREARAGFTLIEIIAVVAIMGLVFAVGIPRLGSSKKRLLQAEANLIASSLDYARQRAIMTSAEHRLLIDLEEGLYRVEWYVTEDVAADALSGGGGGGGETSGLDLAEALGNGPSDDAPISLKPISRDEREYYPVPSVQYGSFSPLDDALYFVGLANSSGWTEGGDVWISFYPDGTTEPQSLEIADADDNHLTLVIRPVLDRVGIRAGSARS